MISRTVSRACAFLAFALLSIPAQAAVFSGIEYGRDGNQPLLLDVRTPAKPGPFPVWVEWVEPGASPLIVPDREVRSADTVLIRALMPLRTEARSAAAAQLLAWLPHSISGYGGDRERAILIVRGAGGQALLDLWKSGQEGMVQPPPRSVRALVLVEPPATLRGHSRWPGLPLLLIDAPERSGPLWRTAFELRNLGIAAEPSVQGELSSASPALSTQIAAMLSASDVPRVQRFDQLALGEPVAVDGQMLDVVHDDTGLVALLHDRRSGTVRLAAVDSRGATRELHRWSWRDDARLVRFGGSLIALGSDSRGRPRAEVRRATGLWEELPMRAPPGRMRLLSMAQRDVRGLALAWTHARYGERSGTWLQHIAWVDAAPRVVQHRAIARKARALAFAGGDVIVALAAVGDTHAASLWRWTSTTDSFAAVPEAGAVEWEALFSLSPDGAEVVSRAHLLGARAGRLYSINLSCRPICVNEELDASGLGVGDASGSATMSSSAQWLQHPETGESLLAVLPWARIRSRSAGPGSWLIRQRNGRYGIARLPQLAGSKSAALRAIVPWPEGRPGSRYALFAGHAGGTLLFPARLQRTDVMPGLWWDRMRSGHGFNLRRSGDGWQVTVYTFDRRGAPVWYRANGELRDGRWLPDTEGLLGYRLARAGGSVEIDRRGVQGLEIVFAQSEGSAACNSIARPGAIAVAHASLVIGKERSEFCLEPLRLAATGRPSIDPDGVWSARDEPMPWQLELTTQGHDPLARISALLTYFDRAGAPRWAYSAGDWRGGAAELQLLAVRGACAVCAPRKPTSKAVGALSLRVSGECGATRVNASLRVFDKGGAVGVPRGPAELAPTTLLGCY